MPAGNGALQANPPNADIDINTHGSDWLWAVFAVFLLADILCVAWGFMLSRGTRAFHTLSVAILTVGVIAYFSMASDLGSVPVVAEFYGEHHQGFDGGFETRAIWFVRYIMWTINGPLLVLLVGLASALPLSDIFGGMFMMVVAAICGLLGALTSSSYKWGYFVFGILALFYVIFHLLVPGRMSAGYIGADVAMLHTRGAGWLSFFWILYPICWGLSDGGNVITSDGEMVFYGILDLFTMPLFLFFHLWSLRTIDYSRFGMTGTGVGGINATGEKRGFFGGAPRAAAGRPAVV